MKNLSLISVASMALLAACVSSPEQVTRDENVVEAEVVEATTGDYLVTKQRATALIPAVNGRDDWASGREKILHEGEKLEVLTVLGRRARVRLSNGRRAYVFMDDIAPVVVDMPMVPVFPEGSSQPAFPVVSAPQPPPAPVSRALIEHSNAVDLPE